MIAEPNTAVEQGYVYILHFRSALATGKQASRHYVGYSKNWTWRVLQHRIGRSRARIMEEVLRRGIGWDTAIVLRRLEVRGLVYTGRDLERYIKRQRHHSRYCPMCGSARANDYRGNQ